MFDALRATLARALNRATPPKQAVLDDELAAPSLAGIRQAWHSALGDITPTRLRGILDAAASGDAYEFLTLAEEMEEKDLHYASVLGTRKLALVGLDVRVDAASDQPDDVRRADAVREIVDSAQFGELVAHLVDALGKGYAVAEIVWDRSGSTWQPRFLARDPRFFSYDRDTGTELRLLDARDAVDGMPLPPYKFIVHTPKIRSGLPIRGGLARLAAVACMCKAWTWRDWMAFADIYGLPMRVGKYGPQASKDDIGKLMAAVANLGSDAAAVMPDSMRIEFEQAAQTTGAGEFFKTLSEFWDKQISKGVLGQTMTADDGASLSQAQVHQIVRLDIMTADARALSNTLQAQLVQPFCDLNFAPGDYPRLQLVVPKPENTELLVNALAQLVPLGMEVEQSIIRDKLGLPDPDPGAALLKAPATLAPTAFNRAMNANGEPERDAMANLGETSGSPVATPISAQTDTLDDAAAPAWDAILAHVQQLVEAAPDMASLRDALMNAYAELPMDRLAEVMAMAGTAAELTGRYDIEQESVHG